MLWAADAGGGVGGEVDGASLVGADLAGATLAHATLAGANLAGARLQRADLTGADLHGARLSTAMLQGANLTAAKLQAADLAGGFDRIREELGIPGAFPPDAEAEATMDRVAEADIAVVTLPMCNLHLQDRDAGATPRWRGVTLVHELAARGVRVSVGSDNTRDPFYDYGDLDMLETFRVVFRHWFFQSAALIIVILNLRHILFRLRERDTQT